MTLWMSLPCHFVPEAVCETRRDAGDELTGLVYAAYGRHNEEALSRIPVPAMVEAVEDCAGPLAAVASGHAGGPTHVRTLFDCRSGSHFGGPAPSYVLAERCGLVRASPIALGGRGGAEVPAAFFLMSLNGAVELPAVVCASQIVLWPDLRSPLSGGILADAAAAFAVGATTQSVNAAFRVIGVAMGSEPAQSISTLTVFALRDAGLCLTDLRWFIGAPMGTSVGVLESAGIPEIGRPVWTSEDFGSADILISLATALEAGVLPRGPGALVHRGWFGALGIVLLEAMS